MRRWTAVVLGVVVLATCVSAYAKQVTVDVSVLNPYQPRYVTVSAGTDIVVVTQGWPGNDPAPYKSIKDLVKNTSIFFSLDACDPSGASIKVDGPKFVPIYISATGLWSPRWEYQIKVKKLPSGTYTLTGTWVSLDGTEYTMHPTYLTIP